MTPQDQDGDVIGIAARIERADEEFRAAHRNAPEDELAADARTTFTALGLVLGDEDLDAYARAVAEDQPFRFGFGMQQQGGIPPARP